MKFPSKYDLFRVKVLLIKMQNSRNIISIILIISMFVSNIGFLLREDCCFENAKLVLNIFDEENCCSENSQEESCCSEIIEKDNCCTENSTSSKMKEKIYCGGSCYTISKYVKLEINQNISEVEKFQPHFEIICNNIIDESIEENHNYFFSNEIQNLPNISGRSLIISFHKSKIPSLNKV
ncbi:MAG: hypothetical protein IPM32_01720 [Ignavibacteriae bacterium]|nr:hypothetical protein [Ignavibacteriota bacterium]